MTPWITHLRANTNRGTKDWIAEVNADAILIRWGPTGRTRLRMTVPKNAILDSLDAEAARRINAKKREGYRDVGKYDLVAGPTYLKGVVPLDGAEDLHQLVHVLADVLQLQTVPLPSPQKGLEIQDPLGRLRVTEQELLADSASAGPLQTAMAAVAFHYGWPLANERQQMVQPTEMLQLGVTDDALRERLRELECYPLSFAAPQHEQALPAHGYCLVL